jgi:hypothetical protein
MATNNPGDSIVYIFRFPDAGAAARDPALEPYPLMLNVQVYDTLVDSVTPLSGYWTLVVQAFPLVPALESHPNVQLIVNQSIMAHGPANPAVLLSNVPNLAYLTLITMGGTYAGPSLQLQ